MHDDKELDAANVGKDPFRPADNMVLDYDPLVDPGGKVGPDADPSEDDAEDDAEKPAASMTMTKAELLDRLHESAAGLTKAQILEHINRVERGDEDGSSEDAALARVYSTETRTATIDGKSLTWTEATEDTVPASYREVYAQSQAAGG